ncbi:MAG: hypothetical protein FJ243_00330 [Nitrospira sp.]|nr:hypothetical protein [Nitrospira sp.]
MVKIRKGVEERALSFLVGDILANGSHCRFQAKGHSMSPFIKDGDVVTVSPLSSSPGIGNVIASIHPETKRLSIHRVIGKEGDSYLIKGDNSSEADGLVEKGNILGYVTKVERDGEKVFIGLGPERFLIAFLSHIGLLSLLLPPLWKLIRPFVRSGARIKGYLD